MRTAIDAAISGTTHPDHVFVAAQNELHVLRCKADDRDRLAARLAEVERELDALREAARWAIRYLTIDDGLGRLSPESSASLDDLAAALAPPAEGGGE